MLLDFRLLSSVPLVYEYKYTGWHTILPRCKRCLYQGYSREVPSKGRCGLKTPVEDRLPVVAFGKLPEERFAGICGSGCGNTKPVRLTFPDLEDTNAGPGVGEAPGGVAFRQPLAPPVV